MATVSREVDRRHKSLLVKLGDMMNPNERTYKSFIRCLESGILQRGRLSMVQENPTDVFALMEEKGVLKLGEYQTLKEALQDSGYINILDFLKKEEECITRQMRKRHYSDGPVASGSSNIEIDSIQKDLRSYYKSLSSIPYTPFDEEETIPIQELYTDVIIEYQTDGRNTAKNNSEDNSRDRQKEKLSSYKQIFVEKRNERIILTGLSGSGKSTFCKQIVNTWCTEEPNRQRETTEGTDPTIPDSQKAMVDKQETGQPVPESPEAIAHAKNQSPSSSRSEITADEKHDSSDPQSSEAITDKDILLQFKLLFYIYTPKISSGNTLAEVFFSHFLKRKSDRLLTYLEEQPEKVLIILDGIDEMGDNIPLFLSDLLVRQLHPRITVLMAMRPWKISQLKLKQSSHYDLLLDVQGLSKKSALKFVQKVINIYNKNMTLKRLFPSPEEQNVLSSFRNIPLLLSFLAHIWCQDQSLPTRQQDLYRKMLQCIIKRCLSKTGNKYTPELADKDDISIKMFWDTYLESACQAAYYFLLQEKDGSSVVMREKDLMNQLGDSAQLKLGALLDCGILSKQAAFSPKEKNVSITFLHLSIHEYLTSMHLVSNEDAFQNFLKSLETLNDVLRYENLFIFICGLDAKKGHMAFIRICKVCDEDPLVIQCRQGRYCDTQIKNLNEMYRACLNEMDSQEVVETTDIVVDCNDEWHKCVKSRLRPDYVKSLYLNEITLLHHDLVDLRSLTNITSFTITDVTMSEECSRSLCSSISSCTHLENLTLHLMELHDGVFDLRSLTNITFLRLYRVTMSEECSRSLCSSISSCTHLENLTLHFMELHDGVFDLRSLTNITFLRLSRVNMSEECSRSLCSSISSCTHLKRLSLHTSNLHDGVLDLRSLTNITFLRLSHLTMSEECSRSLCSSISSCTHLESLSLHTSNLHDGVLDLRSLTNITFLTLWQVTMSEECSRSLCSSISSCTHLETLELNGITLHDRVLDLRSLTNITMSEECSRSLCSSISSCTHLEDLTLQFNELHDCVLDLRSLTNITSLSLLHVTMSEECSRSLCISISSCTHMETLELEGITLHDGVLDLRSLTNITYLTLWQVTMSEECSRSLCSSISSCRHLEILELDGITLHDGVLDLRSLSHLRVLKFKDVTMSPQCTQTLQTSLKYCQKLEMCQI